MKIKIYQINSARDSLHIKFQGLQSTQSIQRMNGRSALLDPSFYDEVFSGDVDCKTLEDIYTMFNTNHPPTHRGHSLSVSDVVQIMDNDQNDLHGFFFCDRFGFEKINFDPKQTQKPDNLLLAVMVEPGKPAYEAEIQDSLKSLQRAVAGHIEVTYPFGGDLVIVSNEESKLIGLPENRNINGETYCGNLFIVGDNHEGEFCSLTDEQVSAMLERFSQPDFFGDEDMDTGIQMS